MRSSCFLLLLLQHQTRSDRRDDFSMTIDGAGLHRAVNVKIANYMLNSSVLLKWDITPDFYVDVYELDRLYFFVCFFFVKNQFCLIDLIFNFESIMMKQNSLTSNCRPIMHHFIICH